MSSATAEISALVDREYKKGFVTDIDSDTLPPGLDEQVVRAISAKKNEPAFMLEWRLEAFRRWQTMVEPSWAHVDYPPIDFQAISYYSAPRSPEDAPKSLDEVDPKLIETYNKLGIPLEEQKILAGVAVDAVFDSVSVATTYKGELEKLGIIFCSISDAIQNHTELIKNYLDSEIQVGDNKFHALNSAVFTNGSLG